jgi:hypothetical protein
MDKIQQSINMADDMFNILTVGTKKQQKPHGYETVITINGYEFECIVDCEFSPKEYGIRENGVPMEPDQPAYIEMGEVWIFDGSWQIVDIPEQAMTDTLDEILAVYEDRDNF